MKILFINSIGREKFGGGEKWMVSAAKGLLDRGHDVTLASRKDSRILGYAAGKGVPVVAVEIHSDISPLKTLRIASYLKKEGVDILVCNLNKDVRVAGLAGRIAATPVVLARHGMLLCGKKWKHRLTLTRLTDGIITNSKTIRDAYEAYGWFEPEFVRVIHNGIVVPPRIEARDFSSRFPGMKIIYSAGRLAEQKGFNYLVEAAEILREKRNDLIFVVSGEGKLETELKAQVREAGLENRFIFEGFAPDIYPMLAGCDLFVLASLFEGMPNVVMEAMAAGKPVVATDVNGARELMDEGRTGIIVPPRDPKAMAEAIESIIDNPEKKASFGKEGKKRVAAEFTMNAMLDRLERHFEEKLAEKRRGR
ncbi:glycosyl transferase [Prosthecochloris sp. GSB1]|uniref:glycosyltransferase n=1 Tax=Prosthecochloris sp. GSB1 TaxID=281093 RepID=UPI000B8D03CF|nr:glycosyltransferase [Prosthecochloris sp. GSB1]ASQ89853.1 glycosyl transferase [Prosthecochloris sp. GSB1]